MQIQFLGATQTVTGSKYLLKAENKTILVDCGLFQGPRALRRRNWDPLPIDPASIDYVLLTHAHIDHSGYIPLLVKNGFQGKIFCTQVTEDLCGILLPDSGYLQEEEARYANLKGYSKHHPALPLYTASEAEAALAYFQPIALNQRYQINENLYFSFHYAGHILGAAMIRVEHYLTSLLFSGDLGRPNDPIMRPPHEPIPSDYYVIESTYGDRAHKDIDPETQLQEIIQRTYQRGGITLIPAFAVGRAQAILYYLYELKRKNQIPDIPVFIDSPMATDATQIFYEYADQHRLSKEQSAAVCKTAQYIHNLDDSIAIDQQNTPMIIISASGMLSGGRILHHLKHFGQIERNTLVFCGFQAHGTRGEHLLSGEREVKLFGERLPIRAEIVQLDNTSAHADGDDVIDWLGHIQKTPRKIFITHGEPEAAAALKNRIEETYTWDCLVPAYLHEEELL